MSISLTEDNTFKGITLHSFNENLEDSNPSEHSTVDGLVTIYILKKDNGEHFGLKGVLFRDAVINLEDPENFYTYIQGQYIRYPDVYNGWIYADELDINNLLRKELK